MASDQSDRRVSFCTCCDMFAPGVDIESLTPSEAPLNLSGTSMATPHLAGVAAQLVQQNNMNRDAALGEFFEFGKNVTSDSNNSPYKLLQTPPKPAWNETLIDPSRRKEFRRQPRRQYAEGGKVYAEAHMMRLSEVSCPPRSPRRTTRSSATASACASS